VYLKRGEKIYDKRMSRSIGNSGEEIACIFLEKKGFKIIDRNVYKKTGELDIVARNIQSNKVHVIEVKTVRGNYESVRISPIENMTRRKIIKLQKTALLYMQHKHISDWQIDAIFIWIDSYKQRTQIQHMENFS